MSPWNNDKIIKLELEQHIEEEVYSWILGKLKTILIKIGSLSASITTHTDI